MKLNKQNHLDDSFSVLRKAQKERGPVVVPDFYRCIICDSAAGGNPGLGITAQRMRRIRYTGVIENVMDCVCDKCGVENMKDLGSVARIVCTGCREVVAMVEPFKEKSGFEWKPGGFYHVIDCPSCARGRTLTGSPIVEKIVFYEANGIPYQ